MAQITVNARSYELVTINDLTLGEARVMKKYTGLSLDRISEIEGFDEGLISGLIHISVARGEPGESERSIQQAVDEIKVADLNSVFMEISEEVEQLPSSARAKRDIATQRFWRGFLAHWGAGPGSVRPERFWQPFLGHWCGLRPGDLADMTPAQLDGCYAWVKAQG